MIVRVALCLLLISCFGTVLSSPEFDLLQMDPGESQFLRHDDLHFVADTEETDRPQTSYSVDDFQASDSATPRSRRLKRGTWSLPRNTTLRFQLDVVTVVIPLNNTFSFLIFDLIYRFVLPTYPQLAALYSTLGKMDVNDIDFDGDRNDLDLGELSPSDLDNLMDFEFFEKQRANDEKRIVYLHAEQIFEKMGYDGKLCLLRAICELAETPLAHHGLTGKLIDLIFQPKVIEIPKKMEKYLKSERIKRHVASVPEVDLLRRPVRDDYTDAYKAGKESKCWARYYSCPISVFTFMNW